MKVLYATDGFDAAVNAGSVLEKIGDKDQLDITVMSVTHKGLPAPEHAVLTLDPLELRRKDTLALVDATCEKLISAGFRARARTAEGHPGPEIVRAIEDDWFDLTVMGGGGRSWLGSHLLGSVSSYVLHSAPWSVMVVHESLPSTGKNRVLVGADGSRQAAFTLRLLSQFADPAATTMRVMSVAQDPSPMFFAVPGSFYVPADSFERFKELRKHSHGSAERLVESAAVQLSDAGFEVEGMATVGNPTEQLLMEADTSGVQLVAVGSRGLGPFRRALVGSVSDHLVRHANATLVGRRLHV